MNEKIKSPLGLLRRLRRRKQDAAQLAFQHTQCQAEILRARIRELEAALETQTKDLRSNLLNKGVAGEHCRLGVNVLRAALAEEKAGLAALEAGVQSARQSYLASRSQAQAAQWLDDGERRQRELARRGAAAGEMEDIHAANAAARKEMNL